MRPTLLEIKERALASMRSSLGIASQARRSVLEAIANAVAGAAHLLYIHADNLFASVFPSVAAGTDLDRWGDTVGLARKAASPARVTATLEGDAGTAVEAGAEAAGTSGAIYTLDADATVPSEGSVATAWTAAVPGSAGDLAPGSQLVLSEAVAGLRSALAVTALADPGEDQEADGDYRDRIVNYFRRTTYRAGGVDDYRDWATQVPGITRAWVAPDYGNISNRVAVFCRKEGGSPTAAELEAVSTHLASLKPVTADVVVLAPPEEAVNMTILIRRDAPSVRASVLANLADLFASEAVPRGTLRDDGTVAGGRVLLSRIREAVSLAAGEEDSSVSLDSDPIPAAANAILVLGNVTFQPLPEA